MKLKVQAQRLQPGDVVGSGERVGSIIRNSNAFAPTQVAVELKKGDSKRWSYWGKYTMINVERKRCDVKHT